MTEAILTWSIWQALLDACASCFLLPPLRLPPLRRVDHRDGDNVEEHTITQSVLALEQARRLEGPGILVRGAE
jgi:hypothetical protein